MFVCRCCESGFIPAGLFTITRWYKRDETSKRFAWYFLGNMTAGACSGIIAYGMYVETTGSLWDRRVANLQYSLHMRGVKGLAGWQWLFIVS